MPDGSPAGRAAGGGSLLMNCCAMVLTRTRRMWCQSASRGTWRGGACTRVFFNLRAWAWARHRRRLLFWKRFGLAILRFIFTNATLRAQKRLH
jgi:hypothetical protein